MDYSDKFTVDAWYEMMQIAFKNGINFFDTAEVYGSGQAEELMGGAIKPRIEDGVWTREDLVLTTKIFLGYKGFTTAGPNDQGVSRKHVTEGTKASLRRLQQDYAEFAARKIEPPFDVRVEKADKLKPIAEEVRCTLPQLALASCVSNEKVSTVIIGASRPSQLEKNLKALAFVAKVTPEVKAKIDAVVNFVPTVPEIDWFAKLRDHHLE